MAGPEEYSRGTGSQPARPLHATLSHGEGNHQRIQRDTYPGESPRQLGGSMTIKAHRRDHRHHQPRPEVLDAAPALKARLPNPAPGAAILFLRSPRTARRVTHATRLSGALQSFF